MLLSVGEGHVFLSCWHVIPTLRFFPCCLIKLGKGWGDGPSLNINHITPSLPRGYSPCSSSVFFRCHTGSYCFRVDYPYIQPLVWSHDPFFQLHYHWPLIQLQIQGWRTYLKQSWCILDYISNTLLLHFREILFKLFNTVSDFQKSRHWTKSKPAAGKMKQKYEPFNLV